MERESKGKRGGAHRNDRPAERETTEDTTEVTTQDTPEVTDKPERQREPGNPIDPTTGEYVGTE